MGNVAQSTIVTVYVTSVYSTSGRGNPGLSLAPYRLASASSTQREERLSFTPPTDTGLMFISTTDSCSTRGIALAHEVGHLLLDTFGWGKSNIEDSGTRDTVVARLELLGIDVERGPRSASGRGQRIYDQLLTQSSHVERTEVGVDYENRAMGHEGEADSNLMMPHGGTTLYPWQVAIFRGAPEVADLGTHR